MYKQLIFTFAIAVSMATSTFAAGVTVEVSGMTATVTGTAHDDQIIIGQPWDGSNTVWIFDVDERGYNVCGILDLDVVLFINVFGGDGDDYILHDSTETFVNMFGEAGNDQLYCGELADWFDGAEGGAGDDFLYAGHQGGSMHGNEGDDSLFGDTWVGGRTNPVTLIGGAGSDWILGSANDDLIAAGDGESDFINCGGGNDFDNEFASFDAIDVVINCDGVDNPHYE